MTPGVIVVGAGGHVGSRIVAGLARTGRTVFSASRGPLDHLTNRTDDGGQGLGRAAADGPAPGRVADDDGPELSRVQPVRYAHIDELGAAVRAACDHDGLPLPGAAVAAIGGWQLGAHLLDQPDLDAWRATLDSHLTTHLGAIRALAPLLRASEAPHPAHIVLNGAARCEPMAGSGAVNVTGAGLAMLIKVLRLEEASVGSAGGSRPLRFHEIVIDHAVAGDDRNVTPDQEVAPAAVVQAIAAALDDPATDAVVHVGTGNGAV